MTAPAATHPEASSILVVDNNDPWASLVERMLTPAHGFGPMQRVRTLEQALEVLAHREIGLVLLDLNLPDSYGLKTLAAVRQASSAIAILVMTREGDRDLAVEALKQGAQEFLIKGHLTPEDVRQAARHCLQRMNAIVELESTEALLRSTLDALPTCITILDGRGVILAVNAPWCAHAVTDNPLIHGLGPGMNLLASCREGVDQGQLPEAIVQALEDLLKGAQDRVSLDYRIHSGRWFEWVASGFTLHKERRVVVGQIEVTEHRKLQAQLLESQALFQVITENLDDLLAVIDEAGQRIHCSDSYQTLLGYGRDEVTAMNALDLIHPEEREDLVAGLQGVFQRGETMHREYRLRCKDGSYRIVEGKGRLIRSLPGSPRQALVVARDITPRKLAEQEQNRMEVQLRHAQKLEAIGQLAAGIAHEINTPIQYIGDNTSFLRETFGDMLSLLHAALELHRSPDPPAEAVQSLFQEAEALDLDYLSTEIPKAITQSLEGVERVSTIVRAMKDFSHPDGRMRETSDLNKAVQSTLTVSRNEWKYLAEVELDLAPDLPLVPVYLGEFNQVILNLIVNAAHAIEAKREASSQRNARGLIRLQTRLEDGWAVIRVSDDGIGIPEAIRDRIFDPFFTTKPVGKGTGQGLSIAHSVIVDKHEGRIEVASEPGAGTTFTILLPLHHGEEAP